MLPETDDQAPSAPDNGSQAAPPPSARRRSCGSATLTGCILLEALTLLVMVAFCATLIGVSFLRQALMAAAVPATPTVSVFVTPEPSPTETETPTPTPSPTPAPVTPTLVPATPTFAAPTASPTVTLTPTPRLVQVFLPVVVRGLAP